VVARIDQLQAIDAEAVKCKSALDIGEDFIAIVANPN
jgi:hypothetical protein